MTTKSCRRDRPGAPSGSSSRWPRRVSPSRSLRRPGLVVAMAVPCYAAAGTGPRSLAARAVQVRPDLPGRLAREAGRGLELLARRRHDRLGRAEVLEQRALARRSDARQVVEDRRRHRPVAPRAVVGDREAMRLVAYALEQL